MNLFYVDIPKNVFQLRPYQVDALETLNNYLQTEKNILLSAIMGAGKTVIICRLINKYYHESDRRFLILAHKQELVEQFRKTFREKTEVYHHDIGICCSGLNQNETRKRITIATIQSFINQIDKYSGCNLLVIDEAHRIDMSKETQYYQVINALRKKRDNMRLIGITATPYRLGHGYIYGDDCIKPECNLFEKINYKITYSDLVNQGYLMKLEGLISAPQNFEDELKNIITQNGDYVLGQLSDVMSKQIHIDTCIQAIEQHCKEFKHICIFTCTIEHAKKIYDRINEPCSIVHSELTEFERMENMNKWKSGEHRIMVSVNILIEGFDFPELDCIVMARPTKSSALFLQAVGRVLRIHPEKEKAFLLDLTNNSNYFGLDLDNIKVSIPKTVSEKIEKEKSFEKECPNCNQIVHVSCQLCYHCGHEFKHEIKEATELPELNPVVFGNEPIQYDVYEMQVFKHEKSGKPDSVRIEYHNEHFPYRSRICSEWICFDHGGYAEKKAQKWWIENTSSDNFPTSTEEALARANEIHKPEKIVTVKDGKFLKIIDKIYDTVPF